MYYLNLIIKEKKSQKLLAFLLSLLWVFVILLVCQHFRKFQSRNKLNASVLMEIFWSEWSTSSLTTTCCSISKNSCFQSYFAIELVILKHFCWKRNGWLDSKHSFDQTMSIHFLLIISLVSDCLIWHFSVKVVKSLRVYNCSLKPLAFNNWCFKKWCTKFKQ